MQKTAAAKAAKATEIADRRRKVAALVLARAQQKEIAATLGVSPAVICQDVKALRAEWAAAAQESIETWRIEELTALNADETALRQQISKAALGDRLKIQDRLLEISDRRCKLLGLYAPTKQDVTSGGKVLDFAALMLAAQHGAE